MSTDIKNEKTPFSIFSDTGLEYSLNGGQILDIFRIAISDNGDTQYKYLLQWYCHDVDGNSARGMKFPIDHQDLYDFMLDKKLLNKKIPQEIFDNPKSWEDCYIYSKSSFGKEKKYFDDGIYIKTKHADISINMISFNFWIFYDASGYNKLKSQSPEQSFDANLPFVVIQGKATDGSGSIVTRIEYKDSFLDWVFSKIIPE